MNTAASTFFQACRRQSQQTARTFITSPPNHHTRTLPQLTTRPSIVKSSVQRAQPIKDLTDNPTAQGDQKPPAEIISHAKPDSSNSSTQPSPSTTSPPSTNSRTSKQPSSSSSATERDSLFVQKSWTHVGHVTRTGTMSKTVRVTRNVQIYDSYLQKYYTKPHSELVHDPQELLVEGDVIRYGLLSPSMKEKRLKQGKLGEKRTEGNRVGGKKTKGIRYVLREVVTPFGVPVEQRVVKDQERVVNTA